jgi:hypothetical protein
MAVENFAEDSSCPPGPVGPRLHDLPYDPGLSTSQVVPPSSHRNLFLSILLFF